MAIEEKLNEKNISQVCKDKENLSFSFGYCLLSNGNSLTSQLHDIISTTHDPLNKVAISWWLFDVNFFTSISTYISCLSLNV